ncbi:HAD-IB family hydrolase [Ferrimonas senticii]|uniref:HAD-IB family hydrolase n=1 Tax=Ferrimonas senticii TaxID=394566 RepID=UPI0003FADA6F|nr:HAD-IB family hydrolase [Ferrimonas senticii]
MQSSLPPPSNRPALALFDFDGTLTHNDNFSAFLYFATPSWRLLLGLPVLLPLKWLWRSGVLSSAITRRIVTAIAYSGRRQTTLEGLGRRYIAERTPQIFRPELLARLQQHQQRGDTVVLVSASLDCYLAPLCRQLGIELLCSELHYLGGIASGIYQNGDCANHYKAKRIQQRFDLSQFDSIYAYGDSDEDRPMLALASYRVLNGKAL